MLVCQMQTHKFGPDFYEILKTKRRSITRSEMKIIKKYFSQQFKIMLETGHIPETFYDALRFKKDGVSGVVYPGIIVMMEQRESG